MLSLLKSCLCCILLTIGGLIVTIYLKPFDHSAIFLLLTLFFIMAAFCFILGAIRRYQNLKTWISSCCQNHQYDCSNHFPAELKPLLDMVSETLSHKYNTELIQKQIEYSALQSQINPHFLYNTLESIRGQALVNQQTEIAKMTEHLSKFFRYSISSRGSFVKLQDELLNVQDYFFIQQYRFEDRFSMKTLVEDPGAMECYIPKLTLQPIIENAIFHGLEKRLTGGLISIRIIKTEKKLYLIISDNGSGIEPESLKQLNQRLSLGSTAPSQENQNSNSHQGIAILNANNRIKLCFGEEYGLRIHSSFGEGTDVEIMIPIVTDLNKESYQMKLR